MFRSMPRSYFSNKAYSIAIFFTLLFGVTVLVPAQAYTSLYDFTQPAEDGTNPDGSHPKGGLTRSGNVLYGVAVDGGTSGHGTVFKVNLNGTGFTTLHNFGPFQPPLNSNEDGANPQAGVILSGNTLYGTALAGGAVGYGTVFKLNTDGTGFTTLHSFQGSNVDGNNPRGPLLLSGNTLYGTTAGNVFRVDTDGSNFGIIRNFGGLFPEFGLDPSHSGLVLIGNTLYGTTANGGATYGNPPGFAGAGEIFAVDTNGQNFRILHHFTAVDDTGANEDGYNPLGHLVLSGNTLYGTAIYGGPLTRGTVYSIGTEGNGFRLLHVFSNYVNFINEDGANPSSGLVLSGNKLFGTTTIAAAFSSGNIFSINTDGTGFDNIYDFRNGLGGGSNSPLSLWGRTLYGTSATFPSGNIFSLVGERTAFDYDGDNRSDISVFRPSSGAWYLQQSRDGLFGTLFGFSDDQIAPADYDGDGRSDIAVYRPSTGIWYVFNSSDMTVTYNIFGIQEDLPTPADYDGDGRADIAVFRPSSATWYRQNSSDLTFYGIQFGASEDKPTVGDFDGDGKADIALFRPSVGAWYQINSSNGSLFGEQFGFGSDIIAPADYDGDKKMDLAVFRPSNGFWYIKESATSTYTAFPFGLTGDVPAAGDFDGDGKADLSIFRPSDGNWYRMNSANGSFFAFNFGTTGDRPTQTAFIY